MRSSIFLLAWAAVATARTDLQGCTSSDVIAFGGASVLWYVPGTGEICSFLDCGGGMAPPMTTVPGCPLYSGTATVTPSFLAGFEDASAAVSSTASVAASTTSPSLVMITGSSTTVEAAGQTTLTGMASSSSTVPSNSVSTELATSTGTASDSKSTSSTGTKSSSSPASGSGSSTSPAASPSPTSNAGAILPIDLLGHILISAATACFAILL